ncbi:MAG: GNAT family N-acetyltransferase [Edaphobacter sp.]|uniref:GNAT family N-acetyltransferase n=1 Tax=Edaphobacter sp. TaxID=1934404 RepID=UPI002396C7FF|nr:GNAT family N-acetyltransferase [Edaphobacter sp.]MDE1178598.1 GNAT family N-acetyltransferase [Edaphobacter sp.]
MSTVVLRQADRSDIPALAAIRATDWGTTDFWTQRFASYLDGLYNPLDALAPRVIYTASLGDDDPVGLVAGHLSRRYDCHGELQWISVLPPYRGLGIASRLFHQLAAWFAEHDAFRICINCDTDNENIVRFLSRHGAVPLSRNWLVWPDIRVHLTL